MELTKIHIVLEFKQSHWMKKYIDFNAEKRMNAANDLEKHFFKLMIKSVYGKTMENLRKRINVRLINNIEDFLKYTSRPTYITHKIFGKDYVAIHSFIHFICFHFISKKSTSTDFKKNVKNAIIISNNYIIT